MNHLYFIRHGQTEMNVARKFAGHIETALTSEGKAQAKAAGEVAKSLGITHIVSSPLGRARDTALIIAKEIGLPEHAIEINSLAIERNMGQLEGTLWDADMDLDGIVDIETTDSMDERARLLLEHLQTLDALVILIVSHGGFGHAMWRATGDHLASPYYPERHFGNAEIIQLI